NSGELLERLHPGAGPGEDAGPLRLHAEDEVRQREADGECGEDDEGHPRGVGEGEADGRSHEGGHAGCGDDGGEDSGEEAAGEALLLRESAAGAVSERPISNWPASERARKNISE